MHRALRLAIPTAIAALTFIACASTSPAPATSAPAGSGAAKGSAVSAKGFVFTPATLTVAKGTKVTFTNSDSAQHTVTSGANRTKDGKFDLPLEGGGGEASFTFDTPGTYEYFCTFHSAMKGTITVQ